LRAPRSGAWQSARVNSRAFLSCHCEARFVSRSNLSFRFLIPVRTLLRYQRLPRRFTPRNDNPHPLSLRGPPTFCHCEPPQEAWQSLFWVSSFSFVWSLGTRDCFVVPLALLAMTVGGRMVPTYQRLLRRFAPRNDDWGRVVSSQ